MKFMNTSDLSHNINIHDSRVVSMLTEALKGGLIASNAGTNNNMSNMHHKFDVGYGAGAHELSAHGLYLPIQT